LSMRQAETITALQEQVNNDDEIKASYRETLGKLVPLELEMKKQITALTARIKELQEALEKIFLCSDAPSCHRIVEQLQAELKQWQLALKVQELEESRDEWKRQWQLTEARNKAAEDRIKELTEALEKIETMPCECSQDCAPDSCDKMQEIAKATLGGKK
jgi:DNA repair exonuclease SbcCD ATPase subunit